VDNEAPIFLFSLNLSDRLLLDAVVSILTYWVRIVGKKNCESISFFSPVFFGDINAPFFYAAH
jgi:hypothetical protein